MLNNIWFIAAIWMGLALVGSLISIWTGMSVALIEILVGVVAGNIALGFEGGTLQIGIAGGNIDAGQLHHVLQSLGMLLDRMEGAAFEAGVFGRVSSGKSSLCSVKECWQLTFGEGWKANMIALCWTF